MNGTKKHNRHDIPVIVGLPSDILGFDLGVLVNVSHNLDPFDVIALQTQKHFSV